MIKICYFASIREQLDCASEQLKLEQNSSTIADLTDVLCKRSTLWKTVLTAPNVQIAVNNQRISNTALTLKTGDEVAFLPPVTGG